MRLKCMEAEMARQITINNSNYMDYSFITPYIRYCEEDRYKQPWELADRKIGDYEFVFVTRGTGRFAIEDRIYDVRANDLILLKPDAAHRAQSLTLPFGFLCIHFDLYVSHMMNIIKADRQFISETLPQKPIKYGKAILDYPEFSVVDNSSYLNTLLKRVILEVRSKQNGFNTVIKALFTDFLFNLFRKSGDSGLEKKYPEEISSIMEYINANYMKRLHLPDIAEHVHLHHTYVSALFKKHTGLTFSEFLILRRLSVARRLLLETEEKIDEIADSVGFCDLHHFSKVFKAHEGLSPSQYRQIKKY